jgi:prepilin-type N-terminal cleavage/methylation domain-containing protein
MNILEVRAIRDKTNGFTLVETLVAISILLVTIVGPITLVTTSLFTSLVARDQLVASYLAQDAMEYVRFVRDTNFLSGQPWLNNGLADCVNVCEIDTTQSLGSAFFCTGTGCGNPLRFDPATGFYGYNASSDWDDTVFSRQVTLIPVNSDEYIVDVTVSWTTRTRDREFTMRDHIYDWRESDS